MSGPEVSFRRARIAVIGPFPPRPGDLSGQTDLLCRLLHDEGAWVQRVNTDVASVRRLPGIGIHLLPIAQILALTWRLLVALPRCDVLHVHAASHWGFYLPVVLTLLLGKLARRRVVISYAGGLARSFVTGSWRLLLPILRRADGLAVPSAYGQELFQRYGQPAVVLPNLLSLEEHPVMARSTWPPLVLWLDDLEPRANPSMALHALALLRQDAPEARLLLVGSGSLAGEAAELARSLGIAGAIAYRPEMTPHQREDAIREASVVWRTASEDNLPQVLLEAAASGTVIVATAVGGVQEILDDGVDALLIPPEDAAALARATARVLSRPFLAESLATNARLAVERFTWRRQRAGWARFYGLAADRLAGRPADESDDEPGDDVLGRTEFLWSDPARPQADGISQPAAEKTGRSRRSVPLEGDEEII